MTSITLLYGIGLFILTALVQVVFWHAFKIEREIFGLGVFYIVLPSLILIFFSETINQGFLVGALHFSLASVYIQIYPALREDTPSFRILFAIEASGKTGLSASDLFEMFQSSDLSQQKIADLKKDGLMKFNSDGTVRLSVFAKLLAILFKNYRKFLGLPIGAG